jgi:hypothetical protein
MFSSPRARRRLLWAAGVAVAALAGVLVFALVPNKKGGLKSATTETGTVQVVPHTREVPMTPKRRAAINRLFDRFVPTAVARRNPVAARQYVTPNLRSQASLAEWRAGTIPVPPFQPRGTIFHGWRTIYSYPRTASVELTLEPKQAQDEVTSFAVNLNLLRGRWLVDGMYQLGTHGGSTAPPPKQTAPSSEPKVSKSDQGLKGRLGFIWILVPVGLLSLIVLVPLALLARDALAYRRVAKREGRRSRQELPPLPRRDRERENSRK